jgi:hypothetical protein
MLGLGCGALSETQSTAEAGRADKKSRVAVLVYMGGFNSCGDKGIDLAGKVRWKHIKTRLQGRESPYRDVRFLISCYDGWTSSTIRWQSSGDPDEYNVPWDHPDQKDQIFDEVVRLAEGFAPHVDVYMVGHSYGAWLESNLVAYVGARFREQLANDPDPEHKRPLIKGLFAMDDINPNDCDQLGYAATLLNMGGGAGCQRAPQQYTMLDDRPYPGLGRGRRTGMRDLIMLVTKKWRRYVEEDDNLHSAELPFSGKPGPKELVRHYPKGLFGTSASGHQRIHVDDFVWDRIESEILDLPPALASLRAAAPLPPGAASAPPSVGEGVPPPGAMAAPAFELPAKDLATPEQKAKLLQALSAPRTRGAPGGAYATNQATLAECFGKKPRALKAKKPGSEPSADPAAPEAAP